MIRWLVIRNDDLGAPILLECLTEANLREELVKYHDDYGVDGFTVYDLCDVKPRKFVVTPAQLKEVKAP